MKATKESEPPVPAEQGASAYLDGAADEAFRKEQRERLRWTTKKLEDAAQDEPFEEEQPTPPAVR